MHLRPFINFKSFRTLMPFLPLLVSSLLLLLAVFGVTPRIIVSLLVLSLLACVRILLLFAPPCISSVVGRTRSNRIVSAILTDDVDSDKDADSVPDDEQSEDLIEDPDPDFC
jgi:hypothetical protein